LVAPLLPIPLALAGDFQEISTCVVRAGEPAKAPYFPVSAGQGGIAAERDIGWLDHRHSSIAGGAAALRQCPGLALLFAASFSQA